MKIENKMGGTRWLKIRWEGLNDWKLKIRQEGLNDWILKNKTGKVHAKDIGKL